MLVNTKQAQEEEDLPPENALDLIHVDMHVHQEMEKFLKHQLKMT